MRILYSQAVFGDEEKNAVWNSLGSTMLSVGPLAEEFERQIALRFNKKFAVFVNSGSSANMLANYILPKGEIITPALTFATTVAPIIQTGHKPVYVDCDLATFLPKIENIESKITSKTVALLIPDLLGNKMDAGRLKALADEKGIMYIQDDCDTITESFGHIVITSFYGSHIITAMGGGGMIMTDDEMLAKRFRTMRDWGRSANESELIADRYTQNLGKFLYDNKFLYLEKGFNFRPVEAMAAFGLEQLKRLDGFLEKRKANFNSLLEFFEREMPQFKLPFSQFHPNWLAFPLLVDDRYELVKYLEEHEIQTRPIFSGNITRHPAFSPSSHRRRRFPNADYVMEHGLLIGIHQGLGEDELNYIKQTFRDFTHRG